MTTTAWGKATVKEKLEIKQGEFATIIELLAGEGGETMVRFAYSTGGKARRGPVTLRAADLMKLRKALVKTPELAAALQNAVVATGSRASPSEHAP